jgi:arsenate reductase-like glutaredoxin family protein
MNLVPRFVSNVSNPASNPGPGTHVDVQIFGIKKHADTRKALRFFAERRMKTHFVDLVERAASLGELRRFAQKFGVAAMVDRESTHFRESGLAYAQLGDERWLERLANDPMLLKMPLTRFANRLTIGLAEAEWRSWLQG